MGPFTTSPQTLDIPPGAGGLALNPGALHGVRSVSCVGVQSGIEYESVYTGRVFLFRVAADSQVTVTWMNSTPNPWYAAVIPGPLMTYRVEPDPFAIYNYGIAALLTTGITTVVPPDTGGLVFWLWELELQNPTASASGLVTYSFDSSATNNRGALVAAAGGVDSKLFAAPLLIGDAVNKGLYVPAVSVSGLNLLWRGAFGNPGQ